MSEDEKALIRQFNAIKLPLLIELVQVWAFEISLILQVFQLTRKIAPCRYSQLRLLEHKPGCNWLEDAHP